MSKEVKRAVVVKKNTCMGNKVQTEEEEDLWYMARDGSFFEVRSHCSDLLESEGLNQTFV